MPSSTAVIEMAVKSRITAGRNARTADEEAREAALLRQVAAGDREALTNLYQLYHARLFKFTFRLTRSYAAADELVNDILLVVWQSADRFRGDSKVSTWIFGIAYRKAMRHLSGNKMKFVGDGRWDETAHDDTVDVETEDWIRHGLDALPPAQQMTINLVFFLGLSYTEIAEVMDCPVNTVKTRMYHARRKLRGILRGSADAGAPTDGLDDEYDK